MNAQAVSSPRLNFNLLRPTRPLLYLARSQMLNMQSEKWAGYNRGFYRKLLMFFGFFTFIAGATQLALGAYIYDKVTVR